MLTKNVETEPELCMHILTRDAIPDIESILNIFYLFMVGLGGIFATGFPSWREPTFYSPIVGPGD